MRRQLWIALCIVLIVALTIAPALLIPPAAQAQGSTATPASWSRTLDFRTADPGGTFLTFWSGIPSTPCGTVEGYYVAGSGYKSCVFHVPSWEYDVAILGVQIPFPDAPHIWKIDLTVTTVWGGPCPQQGNSTDWQNVTVSYDNGGSFTGLYNRQDCSDVTGTYHLVLYPNSSQPLSYLRFNSEACVADGSGGCSTESVILNEIEYDTIGTPTATPIPPTSTPEFVTPVGTPGPIPGAGCSLLGLDNASFREPNNWVFNAGASYATTSPNASLKLSPGGSASLLAGLSPGKSYGWNLTYQADSGATGDLLVGIADQPFDLTPAGDTSPHNYVGQPQAFNTGSISLGRPASATGDVTIYFFCLTDTGSAPAITNAPGSADTCTSCDPPLSIADLIGIINWLLCQIRNLFTCYVVPIIQIVINFIVSILQAVLGFIQWIMALQVAISNFIGAVIAGLVGIFAGFISNLFTGLSNAFHTSGIADTANQVSRSAIDLPTTISNEIGGFAAQLSDAFKTSTGLLDLLLRLIVIGIAAIFRVIGLIPLAIQSLIDGINSAGAPVSGSPFCADTTSFMYGPCLGFYILDNTIFQGPAKYLIPVLTGVVCFDTITWAFNRISQEFKGS